MAGRTMILVTGATGMLGWHIMGKLLERDPIFAEHVGISYKDYNLMDISDIAKMLGRYSPDTIIHCAANVGGIKYNQERAAGIYHYNVTINTELIQQAAQVGVKKFIFIGSTCSYPADNPIPITEDRLWTDQPEASNRAYGLAKLVAYSQLEACYQQYGMDFSYPVLANMYGPHDRGFDDPDRAHVIPALINKFLDPNTDTVTIWGDGTPTRDFLFVEDAAVAVLKFLDIAHSFPVNIASGWEISIQELANLIKNLTGSDKLIVNDTSKPTGQMRRLYDISVARRVLGWKPKTSLAAGLKRTIEWKMEAL